MNKAKQLLKEMEPEDRSAFLEAVNSNPSAFSLEWTFKNVRTMIEGSFIWDDTDEGYCFWERMAMKYKLEG